ncbi:MAG TPA: ATP-binding protein [Gemmatimonadaceae bacterium]|jgi:PAS domain S-box-containing protein|nr:ATP-binding protein [Gemmatimonadaceae bacterium]
MTQTTSRSGTWQFMNRRMFGYLVAAVAFGATIIARYALDVVVRGSSLPLLFIVPIALAAYAGGLGPTIAVTIAGAAAELFLFVGQAGWANRTPGDEIRVVLFVGAGVLIAVTSEAMHRARARTDRVRRRLQEEVEAHKRTEARVAELNEELHRIVREVSRSERQLTFVMDAMPQKVFSATAAGVADYANTQWSEYTGLQSSEITEGKWVRAIHSDDRREGARRWANAMRNGEAFVFEHRIRRYDGVYRWHISRAVPMRDSLGNIVQWVGSSTDVHELKVAQEALREADALKDEFLATLAHELRNPLAPLVTSAEILAHSTEPAATDQARATIRRQIAHMVRLVDDLIDLSRVTRNVIQIRRENITLATVIAAAVETIRDSAECSEQKVTVTMPEEPVQLHADPVRLTQVFSNLLNNACKYTPKGGNISVTGQILDGWIVVRVRDNGIGIPPDKLSHVFGAFARVHGEVNHEQPPGLGIGLALVRRVVDLHGGSVVAESEGVGRGSEFIVRLPVLVKARKADVARGSAHAAAATPAGLGGAADREAPRVSTPTSRPAKTPRRVLVVDDNVDAAEALDTLLSLGGMETRVAHDGIEALYTAAEFRPDAMIVDIGMPRLDGHEVARRMRAAPWAAGIRLVALSGWAQEADRQKSREAGFDVHLAKPVTFRALMEALGGDAASSMQTDFTPPDAQPATRDDQSSASV